LLIDGHYLNLPVMSEAGEIVGMVDVLKLTYATLDQVNSMSTGDNEGPAWNKFWMSLDNETESMMSGDNSRVPGTPDHRSFMSPDVRHTPHLDRGDSVLPNESASHHGAETPDHSAVAATPALPLEDTPFPFKFKAPSGRVHRLQVIASAGMEELISSVVSKLGSEVESLGGAPEVEDGKLGKSGFALAYLDNEGDSVSITTERDLIEAISLARSTRRDKVDLFVHDPEKPPLPATVDPQPALARPPSPPESVLRERRRYEEEEEAESMSRRPHGQFRQEEQLIAGVPNDLLLPGAIVTLAVVIAGVFTLSRATNR
jgi:hypothetical protein